MYLSKLILKYQAVIDKIFVWHFLYWPGGWLKYFWYFEREGDEKNFMQSSILLLPFSVKKELVLKALLTCTFLPWLLDSSNLPSYGLKSGKDANSGYVLRQGSLGGCSALGEMNILGRWFAWGRLGKEEC